MHWRSVFSDRLTRAAGIVLILTIGLLIFNSYSHLADTHPLLGVFAFALVPVLVVVGGVVFILAIWRLTK